MNLNLHNMHDVSAWNIMVTEWSIDPTTWHETQGRAFGVRLQHSTRAVVNRWLRCSLNQRNSNLTLKCHFRKYGTIPPFLSLHFLQVVEARSVRVREAGRKHDIITFTKVLPCGKMSLRCRCAFVCKQSDIELRKDTWDFNVVDSYSSLTYIFPQVIPFCM